MLNTSRFMQSLFLVFLSSGAILAQDEKAALSPMAAPAIITQNRIPRFTDGTGTLADSALIEFNGNIGWGTTTPAHPFTVRRNGATLGVHSIGELFVDRDDRTRSASLTVGTAGTLKWIFGMPFGTDGFQVYDLLANQTRFFVHPDSGNIGVGTTAPGFPLTVAGVINSTSGGFRFPDGTVQTTAATGGGGGGGVTGGGTTGTVPLWSGSAALGDSAIVEVSGKIGIGSANPTETLQVAGTIQSTAGGFKFPDGTLQTTAAAVSPINRIIRGVLDFSGNNYEVSKDFSPNIDPSKAVVELSDAIRSPGTGNGTLIGGVLLVSLDSNTIRVALSVSSSSPGLSPHRVSFQIIEYK